MSFARSYESCEFFKVFICALPVIVRTYSTHVLRQSSDFLKGHRSVLRAATATMDFESIYQKQRQRQRQTEACGLAVLILFHSSLILGQRLVNLKGHECFACC